MQPSEFPRKLLFGRKATYAEFAKYVASQQKIGKTQKEIAKKLGFKTRKSINQIIEVGKTLGYYDLAEKVRTDVNQAAKFYESEEAFNNHPLIEKWVDNMRHRSRGGTPMKTWASLVLKFHTICNAVRTDPAQWVTGNREEVLETGRTLMKAFMVEYEKGNVTTGKNKLTGQTVAYSYAKAARDFMRTHGFAYPDGEGGVMSQSTNTFHGNYADVRLTPEQYQAGKDYIKDWKGLDSDLFRWFTIGIEAMPRAKALLNMKSNYQIVENKKGETFYAMEVFESKTEHYKKGKWPKYIYSADTQESISIIKKRSDFVIEHRTDAATRQIYDDLKEVYRHLRVDKIHLGNPADDTTGYFIHHASHALRHTGAQLWLRKTKWNVAFIASMGWKTTQELIDSYGEMPPEIRIQALDDLL